MIDDEMGQYMRFFRTSRTYHTIPLRQALHPLQCGRIISTLGKGTPPFVEPRRVILIVLVLIRVVLVFYYG